MLSNTHHRHNSQYRIFHHGCNSHYRIFHHTYNSHHQTILSYLQPTLSKRSIIITIHTIEYFHHKCTTLSNISITLAIHAIEDSTIDTTHIIEHSYHPCNSHYRISCHMYSSHPRTFLSSLPFTLPKNPSCLQCPPSNISIMPTIHTIISHYQIICHTYNPHC